ncbi:MAG: branched-chain amino acid ABC transporter permease [Alkalilacustris sp.]
MRALTVLGAIVLVGALLAVPLVVTNLFWLNLAITVLLWAALASAWNISGGLAGGLSLGHAAYFGIGAYVSTLLFLRFGISPWLGMWVGAVLAAGIGAGLATLTLRLRGPFFVLATLAFGIVIHIIAVNWREVTRGAAGLVLPFGGGPQNMMFAGLGPYWYIGLGLVALCVGTTVAIRRSRLGYYLVALREDEDAARSLGVRVVQCKVIAAAISAALTALAGTFYAAFVQYIDPASTTQFTISVQIALVAIVGGMGTVIGPLLGALVVVPLGEVSRAYLGGGPALMVYGVLLIIIVLAVPRGVAGGVEAMGRAVRRLRASNRGGDDA